MKHPFLFSSLALTTLFTSCASIHSSNRGEKQQVEMALHRVRTDVEELKHDLSTQQMQLGIYEGKLVKIDDMFESLKIESSETQKSTLDELQYHIAALEKRIDKQEAKQKEILSDLTQLESHANHTIKALSQYKDKIKDIESAIALHNDIMREIGKLKSQFSEGKLPDGDMKNLKAYKVKSGDSVQRIAKRYHISSDSLMKINNLKDDLILVGQELMVPASD